MSGTARATVGAIAVVAAASLSACGSSSATVAEVHVSEDGRTVDVIVNTCHADLDIDVDETPDAITISASRRDREFLGGDDCQDAVRVALEEPVGSRTFLTSGGRQLPVVTAAESVASSEVNTPTSTCDDPAPHLELLTADTRILMDLIFVERFCGYHGDGAPMLDRTYRPPAFPASPGRLGIAGVPTSAEVRVDVRLMTEATTLGTIRPTTAVEPEAAGGYSVDTDERGCAAISIAWSTSQGRGRGRGRGQQVALMAPPGTDCRSADT